MMVNGVARENSESLSIVELLQELAIGQRGIAVAVNGEIVRRSQWATTRIEPTDAVEIVTAMAGG